MQKYERCLIWQKKLIFQQVGVENFILPNGGMDVSLQRVKEAEERLKFFDMNCLSWLPTLRGGHEEGIA